MVHVLDDRFNGTILTETPLVQGDDWQFDLTVTKNGGSTFDLSTGGNATATATIFPYGKSVALVVNASMTLTTAATGITRLTLTDVQTDLAIVPAVTKPENMQWYIGEVKIVTSAGVESRHGPFLFPVRAKLVV